MRFVWIMAALGASAVAASAAVNLDSDKFQFVNLDMGRGVLSVDITSITHTGDAATLTLVEWDRPAMPQQTIITPMEIDCAAKTVTMVGMETRRVDGSVIKTDATHQTPVQTGVGKPNVFDFVEALACSRTGMVSNLPVVEGKAAAVAYAEGYFASHPAEPQ